jgi:alanine-glyoxylate transaminase/serine-glyoxylate transaminase/serine-pyruvate transaminase
METAKLPRTFFDFRDMLATNAKGGYPYTPPLQIMYGLRESLKILLDEEGLDAVFARHRRIAEGVRRAVAAWGMKLVAKRPELYSDTVSAIFVPEGFDSNVLAEHAYAEYDMSFGVGLGELNGKAFRIGHLGSLTDAMALSGWPPSRWRWPISTIRSRSALASPRRRTTIASTRRPGEGGGLKMLDDGSRHPDL